MKSSKNLHQEISYPSAIQHPAIGSTHEIIKGFSWGINRLQPMKFEGFMGYENSLRVKKSNENYMNI